MRSVTVKKNFVHHFMDWWEKLPVIVGFFLIPLVLLLYSIAIFKKLFSKKEK